MKKLISTATLLIALSTTIFAAGTKESGTEKNAMHAASIQGGNNFGIEVKLSKDAKAKTSVLITDENNNKLCQDNMSSFVGNGKTYRIAALDEGDYTITVATGADVVRKQIHIYSEDGQKTYFINQ